jgi:hypothetical protein
MKKVCLLLIAVLNCTLLMSCSHKKTKQDCVQECEDRGSAYVGIVPNGRSLGPDTYDVCQCK